MGLRCLFIDAAQLLLSTLQLLLTRILPLITLLVGSLLLHLFRQIASFLLPQPGATSKPSFLSRRRTAQGRRAMAATDGGFFPLEESYEDCLDADDPYFIEQQQQPVTRQEEEVESGEVDDHHFFSPEEDLDGAVLQVPVKDVSMHSSGEIAEKSLQFSNSRESHGFQMRGEMQEENYQTRADNYPAQSTASTAPSALLSQGSLFPSDLPPSLDHVIDAAAEAAGTSRTLPPTFSDVQKAVQDLNSSTVASPKIANTSDAVVDTPAAVPTELRAEHDPAAQTASFDNFLSKFRHHFRLEGH